jgi:RND family efflux transporter MFP subunit
MLMKKMMLEIRFIGFLLVILILGGCRVKSDQRGEEKATVVKEIVAMRNTYGCFDNYVGTVEETGSISLSFQVSGHIERINVDQDEYVKRGQLLAAINSEDIGNMYSSALASSQQAGDAYRRYKKLYEEGSLPEIKWMEIQSKYKQAVSATAIARNNLGKSQLRAPKDGFIISKDVESGMNVIAGEPVLKLVDINNVNIRFSVPEDVIASLKVGQEVIVHVAALDGRRYVCRITEKGIMANPVSHTYEVKCMMTNSDHQLLPGMVCSVKVQRSLYPEEIIVPVNAVLLDTNGKNFVWIDKNGVAIRRYVNVKAFLDKGIAVGKGLHEEDRVIVEGLQKISQGMKVQSR